MFYSQLILRLTFTDNAIVMNFCCVHLQADNKCLINKKKCSFAIWEKTDNDNEMKTARDSVTWHGLLLPQISVFILSIVLRL